MMNEYVAQAFEDAAETAMIRREAIVDGVLGAHQEVCPLFQGDAILDLDIYGPPGGLRVLCVCGVCGAAIDYVETRDGA